MLYPKHKIEQNSEYFSLTLTADAGGVLSIEAYTQWVGFADPDNRIEIRESCVVVPERIADFWTISETPFCIVNSDKDLLCWYLTGGHALIKKEIAIKAFPDSMSPSPCIKIGKVGFDSFSTSMFRPAPTPKIRMKVLKRDKYRCKICGRRPDNDTDIVLHVHHITPFNQKGVTHEDNLITLCHTCHKGLDPHREWDLYDLVDYNTGEDQKTKDQRKYFEAVHRYQECIQKRLNET